MKLNTATKDFSVIKQLEVPKVYSACISARSQHSGYHKDEDLSGADHDNTYYANVTQAQDNGGSSPDAFKFQKGFGEYIDSDEEIEHKMNGGKP